MPDLQLDSGFPNYLKKHPHFTGEQHLGIIPLVSLCSSLDFINCPCFSCFSAPAEDLSWSRGTCKFANLNTWHNSTEIIPDLSSYKKLSLQFMTGQTWKPVLWPYIWKSSRGKTWLWLLKYCSLHSALAQDAVPHPICWPHIVDSHVGPFQGIISIF